MIMANLLSTNVACISVYLDTNRADYTYNTLLMHKQQATNILGTKGSQMFPFLTAGHVVIKAQEIQPILIWQL